MVSFATKTGSNVRTDLRQATFSGDFLRIFKDGKDCRVRFLQDPENWLKYREHYSQATKYFPCTQDETCPGCNSEDQRMRYPSRKYIAQALIVNEDGAKDVGKVRALKLTVDLANRLVNKADRNGGTLLNRDYTIIRIGNDQNTTYDIEVEDKSDLDLSKYEFVDAEKILEESYEAAWGKQEVSKPVAELIKQGAAENQANGVVKDKPPF